MRFSQICSTALGALVLSGSVAGVRTVARADTGSTVAIAAGAAAIVGALLYDSSNRPYYVRNNHRYYVTQGEAQYYRGHHKGVMRNAYVPETEYPVSRDPYHGHGNGHGNDHSHAHR